MDMNNESRREIIELKIVKCSPIPIFHDACFVWKNRKVPVNLTCNLRQRCLIHKLLSYVNTQKRVCEIINIIFSELILLHN